MTISVHPAGRASAPRRRWRGLPLTGLILGAITIGFAPILVRLVLEEGVGPMASAFWRMALATPLLFVLAGRWRPTPPAPAPTPAATADSRRRGLWMLVWAGVFFAGDLIFWHLALAHTTVAKATIMPNLAPVVVTVLAWALLGERITRTFLAALVLAVGGAVVMVLGGAAGGADARPDEWLGDLFGVAVPIFYGAYLLAIADARRAGGFNTQQAMAGSTLVGALVILPFVFLLPQEVGLWPQGLMAWVWLMGLGLVAHVVGQGLIAWALAYLPTTFSSIGLLVQPVTAALLALIIFGEALLPLEILGMACVLAGVVLARLGSVRRSDAAASATAAGATRASGASASGASASGASASGASASGASASGASASGASASGASASGASVSPAGP